MAVEAEESEAVEAVEADRREEGDEVEADRREGDEVEADRREEGDEVEAERSDEAEAAEAVEADRREEDLSDEVESVESDRREEDRREEDRCSDELDEVIQRLGGRLCALMRIVCKREAYEQLLVSLAKCRTKERVIEVMYRALYALASTSQGARAYRALTRLRTQSAACVPPV